jgi:hypothetical protein
MKIQSQYNLAQEQCHTNTDKFGLNFTGLQTVNTALGSKSNTYCTLAKRLKRSMEHNERQLMKVSLIANEINRGKNER